MKKKLFGLLMLFGLIGSLASCSSDDDNNGEGETDDVSIVGKWDVNQKQALNCTWEPEIEIKLDLMLRKKWKCKRNEIAKKQIL